MLYVVSQILKNKEACFKMHGSTRTALLAALPSSHFRKMKVTKRLAAYAALIGVPTLIAGVYGQPPAVDGDEPGKYYGYFANQYGEQAVFISTASRLPWPVSRRDSSRKTRQELSCFP